MPEPDDFSRKNAKLRDRILRPCGGWLGELTIFLSSLTGIWDAFILATIFVVAWVLLRTSARAPALVGGLLFDAAIPYQYQNHERFRKKHEKHLAAYWPVCIGGTILELVCWVLAHPNICSLMICLKTTLCLAYWLSKRSDGTQVILDFGNHGYSRSATSSRSTPSRSTPSRSNANDGPPPPLEVISGRPTEFPPFTLHPSKPNIYQELIDLGYNDPMARWYIAKYYSEQTEESKREHIFKNFYRVNTPEKRAERMKDYNSRAMKRFKQEGWLKKQAAKAAQGSGSNVEKGGIVSPEQAMEMTKGLKDVVSDDVRRDIRSELIKSKTKEEAKAIAKKINTLMAEKQAEKAERERYDKGPRLVELGEERLKKAEELLTTGSGDVEGLGVSLDVMKELIKRLLNRATIAEAEADIKRWEEIANMSAGRAKREKVIALMSSVEVPY